MSAPPNQEIEAKYRIHSRSTADHMASTQQLSAGFTLGGSRTSTSLDVYYDTASFDLLRRGLGLRIRQNEGEMLVTAKTLDVRRNSAVHHRIEFEDTVAPSFAAPPYLEQCTPELQSLVQERNPRGKKLAPVLTLIQKRTKREVWHASEGKDGGDKRALAELSVDDVRVVSGPPPQVTATELEAFVPLAEYHELELELVPDGEYKHLYTLARRLSKRRGLQKTRSSKLEKGLSALSRFSGDMAEPNYSLDMHMAEACRQIWRQQLVQILLMEHGARVGEDPEYVHDMRVAIRRARTAYKLFGQYFRRRDVNAYFVLLRNLGRLLGRVRDLDVALDNLQTYRRKVSRSKQADVSALIDRTQREREAARNQLIEWLDGKEYAAFVARFMKFTASAGKGVKKSVTAGALPLPFQVRHAMPLHVLERFERVRAYETLFESDVEASAEQLHALRIECKYLRYILEFNAHLLKDEGAALIDQLKLIQDHLGDLNDCFVEYDRLSGQDQAGSDGSIVQQRLQHLSETASRLQSEFPARFAQFVSPANRRLLADSIANL